MQTSQNDGSTSAPIIYYIRHGLTNWNAEHRFQGKRDIPLNDIGRAQASENGKRLNALIKNPQDFDFISSPLIRTRETMELIRAQMGLDITSYQTDDRLVEMNYGDLEGVTLNELEQEHKELFEIRKTKRWQFQPPNGESLQMTEKRIAPFFNGIKRNSIIVAHGAVGRTVRKHILNLDEQDAGWFIFPQDKVFKFVGGQEEIL
ncbi:MAG: histidine phosphatase family protein [Nitratireductor sp.]